MFPPSIQVHKNFQKVFISFLFSSKTVVTLFSPTSLLQNRFLATHLLHTDTEEASETDIGRHEEPLEIKEQMYQDKLAMLKKKLQQLHDGTHHDYNRKVKKLEYQYKERLRLNTLYRDYMIECVERDYVLEKKAAAKEFDEKKVDLRENLIAELEDKKKTIEAERFSMELTGDSMEVKPVMTRKLRRRPNDPVPVPEKRRKPATAQIVYQLDEKEIENDLRIINKGKMLTQIRKPGRCFRHLKFILIFL